MVLLPLIACNIDIREGTAVSATGACDTQQGTGSGKWGYKSKSYRFKTSTGFGSVEWPGVCKPKVLQYDRSCSVSRVEGILTLSWTYTSNSLRYC